MFSLEDFKLAQKYPFCQSAKLIVRSSNISLDGVNQNVLDRAKAMVRAALTEKDYNPQIASSKVLLEQEVLAYPVAKIIVSLTKNDQFVSKFCASTAKRVFVELEKEKKNENLFLLASDLGLAWNYPKSANDFAEVSVVSFLQASFKQDFLKLVNQRVESGKVFLSKNEFCRLIAFFFEQKLLSEFPLEIKSVPKAFASASSELSSEYFENRSKRFSNAPLGSVKPEFFPPCIERLYSDILGGRNLTHNERFVLATFMLSIGAEIPQVIDLYKNTPNFDEKITSYQVTRLAGQSGKKISSPGCLKMAEYGLRLPNCPCVLNQRIKHPVQVYRKGFFSKAKQASK